MRIPTDSLSENGYGNRGTMHNCARFMANRGRTGHRIGIAISELPLLSAPSNVFLPVNSDTGQWARLGGIEAVAPVFVVVVQVATANKC